MSKETAQTLCLIAAIFAIIAFIVYLIGGFFYVWSWYSFSVLGAALGSLDPLFGGAYAAAMAAVYAMYIVYGIYMVISAIVCLIIGIRGFKWRHELPGGSTLLVWGIIGLILGGVGILLIIAHFVGK
ncbi:MAG: hypothetical protein ACFFCO_08355 [Promethearchaeota archaeon]